MMSRRRIGKQRRTNGNKSKHGEVDSKDLADQVLGGGCLPDSERNLCSMVRLCQKPTTAPSPCSTADFAVPN